MKVTRVFLEFVRERDENRIVKEETISVKEALRLPNDALLRVEDSTLDLSYITHAARPYRDLISARQFKEKIENLDFGDPIPDMTLSEFWKSLPDEKRNPQTRHKFNDGRGNGFLLQLQPFGGAAKGRFSVSVNHVDMGFLNPAMKLKTLLLKRF